MQFVKAFVIAMSMYSRIPMPKVEWNEKNMKYAMCFFPVVGFILGVLEWSLACLLWSSGVDRFFRAVVMTILPILITGGIHFDGFMDTMDALSSQGSRERKLEILKDPNAGAFAILGMCVYFFWNVAVWTKITVEMLPIIGCGYILSRALSGLSVVTFSPAKDSGLARTFQDGSKKKVVTVVMTMIIFVTAVGMILLQPFLGAVAILSSVVVYGYYKSICKKQFGGITGDLAGYFLQLCELGILTAVVFAGGVLWK